MQMNGVEIVALAGKHGLTLAPESVQLEESGADFLAAFADDTAGMPWVLRLPRRADVLPRAASEGRALALIRPRLPVAVPEWRIDSPELIAYPRLAGTPAVVEGEAYVWPVQNPPPHATFIESLAAALAALHGTSHEAAAAANLRVLTPAAARARPQPTKSRRRPRFWMCRPSSGGAGRRGSATMSCGRCSPR